MPDEFPTVKQKLNSRTLWVTAMLLILGLGIGFWTNAVWVPDTGKALVDLALFSAGIMVGKAGT